MLGGQAADELSKIEPPYSVMGSNVTTTRDTAATGRSPRGRSTTTAVPAPAPVAEEDPWVLRRGSSTTKLNARGPLYWTLLAP